MATMNESIFNTPAAKRALKLHEGRIAAAANARKKRGLETGFERRLATAITLENTRRQVRAMEESYGMGNATQPSNIGQYKRFALDMVAALVPNLIAPDIVSVQAIDNRVGMINILNYQYGNTKGAAIAGQTFASPLGYAGTDAQYTSSAVTETITNAASEKGTPVLTWTPVKTQSVHVYSAAGAEKHDVTFDTTGALQSGSLEIGDIVTYLYDNETVPVQTPTMKLDIKSLPIETRSRKLQAIWAFDAQYELTKEYGQDIHQMLAAQAVGEIQQEIDNEITMDLYRAANAGPEIIWSRTQPTGVNQIDHYDSFYTKIVEGSNQIFAATRKARANFMVCGINVASVLQVMRNFSGSEDTTAIGPHFIGTLSNGIKVYVNPNYDANTFVLGYKGATLIDAGYVYAPYMPILTTDMVTLSDDFASRQGWATTYGTKMVNPRLYVKGRITG